jgi:calcineurin-like phosphoesterase family protein
MTTWFTSDNHFGHANIIKYCNRPFDSVDEMNEVMIERWNEVVDPSDRVVVVGDFALGKISETLPLAKRLNGEKFLCPGNHDRVHPSSAKGLARWTAEYEAVGFKITAIEFPMYMKHGRWAIVSHFPYTGDSHQDDRYAEFRPEDEGLPIIHGHVHDQWKIDGRQFNVGVDVWDFYPVHEETIFDALYKDSDD